MIKIDKYFIEVSSWFSDKPTVKIKECLICGSKTNSKLHGDIVKCYFCEFIFNSKQPTEEVLTEFYANSTPMKIWSHIKLKNDTQINKFKYFADFIKQKKLQSVFDYGCGNGVFLNMLSKKIVRLGLEINADANEINKKLDIITNINDIKHFKKKFDFITLCGVLEHLTNPKEVITNLSNYLDKDSYVGIIVPNIESLIIKLGKEKVSTFCPQHLWYFSLKSLKRFMSKFNFELESYTTIEPELEPIANILNNREIYYKNDNTIINKVMEKVILDNDLGYKIVAIFKKGNNNE